MKYKRCEEVMATQPLASTGIFVGICTSLDILAHQLSIFHLSFHKPILGLA